MDYKDGVLDICQTISEYAKGYMDENELTPETTEVLLNIGQIMHRYLNLITENNNPVNPPSEILQ